MVLSIGNTIFPKEVSYNPRRHFGW